MLIATTLFGKLILLCLRLIGRRGTALPGLLIEKLNPDYLKAMLDTLPMGVIVITGTNGKTTTTKMVTELLRATGLRVLTNPTGSNFVRGTIAAIAEQASPSGKLPFDIAVFEQDEAHAVRFAERYAPTGVVALNVMRDQMDRFGEIDTTAKLIGKLVATARDWVVLNANDKRIAQLSLAASEKPTIWFGHSQPLLQLFLDDDQLYSKQPVFYQAAKPAVLLVAIDPPEMSFEIAGKGYMAHMQLDGSHNALNATAALATLLAAKPKANVQQAIKTLEQIKPAFGRGEVVNLPNGGHLRLQLVKNPAGFRHALQLTNSRHFEVVGIAINDDYADGRDVSWLWDVPFGGLEKHAEHIVCGGTRAADMAVRLKYDEIAVNSVEPNLANFLKLVEDQSGEGIIFCTYTAMLQLRKLLKKQDQHLRKEGL